jgi:UDP-2,3-diacylglucosamine hydrolase
MGRRIGVIAGSGRFVLRAISEMGASGLSCVVAGIKEEADPRLRKEADLFKWFRPGDAAKAVSFFKNQAVSEVMMIGKVRGSSVFQREHYDKASWRLQERIKEKSPTAVLKSVIAFLEAEGLEVVSPFSILTSCFCEPGVLTEGRPSAALVEDIDFGLRMARRLADLDIGQTLVVKGKAVVAVEGMEGTDQTIRRGGQLAGRGFVAVKAARTSQDLRLDVPAVGLDTVRSLIRAGGAALGLEAFQVAFFQKEEAIALANSHGVTIVVRILDEKPWGGCDG